MLDRLFGPHAGNLQKALTRTGERHSLLTANLANINVAGYKRQDVEFGVELEGAEQAFDIGGQTQNKMASKPKTREGEIRVDGNSVDLEQEVAGIAECELRYEMLTEMTARYFSGLKSVIKEGR